MPAHPFRGTADFFLRVVIVSVFFGVLLAAWLVSHPAEAEVSQEKTDLEIYEEWEGQTLEICKQKLGL